jgi:hypothetical protein
LRLLAPGSILALHDKSVAPGARLEGASDTRPRIFSIG